MVTAQQLRGELQSDVGFLKGEIFRLAKLSKEVKQHRAAIVEKAEQGKSYIQTAIPQLRQGRLNPLAFKLKTKQEVTALGTEMGKFVVVDNSFERELWRAKTVLDDFKKVFSHARNSQWFAARVNDAELNIFSAEQHFNSRIKTCMDVIRQSIDPFIDNVDRLTLADLISKSEIAYNECYRLARDIDELTVKVMGQILKAYGTLLKYSPLLINEAHEMEIHYPRQQLPNRRARLLE